MLDLQNLLRLRRDHLRLRQDLVGLVVELGDESARSTLAIARRIERIAVELPRHFEEEEEILPPLDVEGCPDHAELTAHLNTLRELAKLPLDRSYELRAATTRFIELIELHLQYEEPLLSQLIVDC